VLEMLRETASTAVDNAESVESLDEEERLLYEEAAQNAEALKILMRDCVCGARLDEAIEQAEVAARLLERSQCTIAFSTMTSLAVNAVLALENLMYEKDREMHELRVANRMIAERVDSLLGDLIAMETVFEKELSQAIDDELRLHNHAHQVSQQLAAVAKRFSFAVPKELVGPPPLPQPPVTRQCLFLKQKELFEREVRVLRRLKQVFYEELHRDDGEQCPRPFQGRRGATSADILEKEFRYDVHIPIVDKSTRAKWYRHMLSRAEDIQLTRRHCRALENQLMCAEDIKDPKQLTSTGVQTMKEEDVPGSPAWERKYQALREATSKALRPAVKLTLDTKELVGEELVVRSEMRRSGFEKVFGIPGPVVEQVENVMGSMKEMMLFIDFARVNAVTILTSLVKEDEVSAAMERGNFFQMQLEKEMDDGLDNMRRALIKLKHCVVEATRPRYVVVPAGANGEEPPPPHPVALMDPTVLLEDSFSKLARFLTKHFGVVGVPELLDLGPDVSEVVKVIRKLDAVVDLAIEAASTRRNNTTDLAAQQEQDFRKSEQAQLSSAAGLLSIDFKDFMDNLQAAPLNVEVPPYVREAMGVAASSEFESVGAVIQQMRKLSEWMRSMKDGLEKLKFEYTSIKYCSRNRSFRDSRRTTAIAEAAGAATAAAAAAAVPTASSPIDKAAAAANAADSPFPCDTAVIPLSKKGSFVSTDKKSASGLEIASLAEDAKSLARSARDGIFRLMTSMSKGFSTIHKMPVEIVTELLSIESELDTNTWAAARISATLQQVTEWIDVMSDAIAQPIREAAAEMEDSSSNTATKSDVLQGFDIEAHEVEEMLRTVYPDTTFKEDPGLIRKGFVEQRTAAERRQSQRKYNVTLRRLFAAVIDYVELSYDEVSLELQQLLKSPDALLDRVAVAMLEAINMRRAEHGHASALHDVEDAGPSADELEKAQCLFAAAEEKIQCILREKLENEGLGEEEIKATIEKTINEFRETTDQAVEQRRVESRRMAIETALIRKGPDFERGVSTTSGTAPSPIGREIQSSCSEGKKPSVSITVMDTIRDLVATMTRDERTALTHELIGDLVVKLHKTLMSVFGTEVFRRLRLRNSNLRDPLEVAKLKSSGIGLPNVPELLRFDCNVLLQTYDLLREDTKRVIRKMKAIFQRIKARIELRRIKGDLARYKTSTKLQSGNGYISERQQLYAQRREEILLKQMEELAKQREAARQQQEHEWGNFRFVNRKLLEMHSVLFFVDAEEHRHERAAEEAHYQQQFKERMERWFYYNAQRIKKTPSHLAQKLRSGAENTLSETVPSTPPQKMAFLAELSRRQQAQGSPLVAARTVKLTSDEQRDSSSPSIPSLQGTITSTLLSTVPLRDFRTALGPATTPPRSIPPTRANKRTKDYWESHRFSE
jgi:hypothetical protein